MAGVLVHRTGGDPARRVVRGHRDPRGPGPGEHVRVGHRELVVERPFVDAREPLDQAQAGPRRAPRRPPQVMALVGEGGRLDDEGVALPVPPRVAEPLADVRRDVRSAVGRDQPELVEHLVQHDHPAFRLQDVVVHVVALQRDEGQAVGEAALAGVGVRVGVERPHAVARRVGRQPLASGRRPRDAPVGRVGDQRRPAVARHHLAAVHPELVVGADVAGDEAVGRRARLGRRRLERRRFLRRQHVLAGHRRGPFHGRQGGVRPDALDVRRAPRRAGRRPARRLRERGGRRQGGEGEGGENEGGGDGGTLHR